MILVIKKIVCIVNYVSRNVTSGSQVLDYKETEI